MSLTLLAFCDRMPPRLCRLVARERHGRKGLSLRQIAQRSGLSLACVSELSRRATWRGLKIETVEAFSRACGVDLFRLRRHVQFLKRGQWRHIEQCNFQQRRMYERLLRT